MPLEQIASLSLDYFIASPLREFTTS